MAKSVSPPYWKITLNGCSFKRGFHSRQEADAFAERWQGSHGGNRGLLKHKDLGDHVEAVRDTEMERDLDERVDAAQRNEAQRMVVQYDTEHTP